MRDGRPPSHDRVMNIRRHLLAALLVVLGLVAFGFVLGQPPQINPGKPTCSLCVVGAGPGRVAP